MGKKIDKMFMLFKMGFYEVWVIVVISVDIYYCNYWENVSESSIFLYILG